MKNIVSTLVLFSLFVVAQNVFSASTTGEVKVGDTVTMACRIASFSADRPIIIGGASVSANAPAVNGGLGMNCAQTLSDLLTQGYALDHVIPGDSGHKFYTLLR
jgi:hypothetical protein